jgi:uroporphyrinogen III methyltransferase/synthase
VDSETNWEALAAAGGTIVVLMGVAHRGQIAARLLAGGLDPATPVAAVTWGTRPEQRSARTTLAALGDLDLEPPATIVIGAVAGVGAAWYERLPLFGRTVVVTRARTQASEFASRLRALGARPLEVPTIAIGPPADGGAALGAAAAELAAGAYQWVVVTSANAVDPLMERLRDARSLAPAQVAAIGPGTAAALRRWHIRADLVPEEYVAEGLLEVFPEGTGRVLLPRAAVARDVLPAGLARRGWHVDVVEAYRTERPAPPASAYRAAAGADAVAFTASSTVEGYLQAGLPVPPVVACIGPVTAATARKLGLEVTVEASPHTLDGLTAALARALA